MILHDDIIHCFVHDKPLDPTEYQVYPKPVIPSMKDVKRKDIVMELHSHILPIILDHHIFNSDILQKLVPNYNIILSNIHVHVWVHAPKPYDIYQVLQGDEIHIYIDLLQIADQTPIVSRMVYILKHELSKICCNVCMNTVNKTSTKEYLTNLNEDAFYHGFALVLSWNEDITNYNFQNTMYEKYKEKAFGMLFEAMQTTNSDQQSNILQFLHNAPFWERFTQIAGMFYLYDIFMEFGVDGFVEIYQNQADHFIQSIFQ